MRLKSLVACKKETNQVLGAQPPAIRNATFLRGYAQRLTEYISPESVDYIFTDPPYGSHIAYLDLTRMWDAWLGFEITKTDLQEETIEGGDAKHTVAHFKETLSEGIGEMFKSLKYDRWMSLVFAHREPAMWDAIVKACEKAGFEYVNTVAQPVSVVWSMHKKKNPLTVLSGELILNFRKVRNPRTLAITKIGGDAVSLIKDSAELSIVQNDGASTDQIYADLIPKLLENGLLGDVSGKIGDITPILSQEFIYDPSGETWHVKPGRKLGSHIPLERRIRFYVTDFLNQCARLGSNATIDEIVMTVLPKLKNGTQPTKQRILDEVRKIADPYAGKFWVLRVEKQRGFDFAETTLGGTTEELEIRPEGAYEHNELLYALAILGRSAGFECHVGKKEQTAKWGSTLLAELSVKDPAFLRSAPTQIQGPVSQIDLIWMDANVPVFAFEIEHSTPMTTAIDRFIELLKVSPTIAERLVIVAPHSRRKKLDQVLSGSHYIGAPMYMEAKVRYLWYSDAMKIARRFSAQQPDKGSLMRSLLSSLNSPKVGIL